MNERVRLFSGSTAALFAIVLLALAFLDKGQITGDGILRWEALRSLAERGELTPEKYTIAQPLLAWPLWMAGEAGARLRGEADAVSIERAARHAAQRYNKWIALGIAFWMFRFLRGTVGASVRHAGLGVMVLLFGSLLLPHAKDFYSEPTWTLATLVALGAAARVIRGDPPSGAAVAVAAGALAIWVNPALAPVFVATGGALVMLAPAHRRRIAAIAAAAPLALGATILAIENALRRGHAWDFGYPGESFSTPLLEGLAGLLASPTRGLVFFVPALLPAAFAFARRRAFDATGAFAALAAVYSVALLFVYAQWHAWHGMWYWGPRFLLPVSVFAVVGVAMIAARAPEVSRGLRVAAAVTVLASFLVYEHGVVWGQSELVECLGATGDSPACFWEWKFLPYAAYVDGDAWARIAAHRSTLVLAGTLLAFALWWRAAPQEPNRNRS